MTLTSLEITERLIAVYTKAIDSVELESTYQDAYDCCVAYKVNQGMCMTMAGFADNSEKMRSNYNMMHDIFKEYRDPNSQWCGDHPGNANTKAGVSRVLRYRLEILYEIMSQLKQSI